MTRANPEARPRNVVGAAIQVVVLLLLTAILGGVLIVLFGVISLVKTPNEVASGVTQQAGQALSAAQQTIQNATDPNHPPTGLSYDTEFTAIDTWHVGDALPGGTDYALTLQAIKRRDGANSPETGLYGVIHAELRRPRETRILGQVIRSDSDPHDYVVYTGEAFRIGKQVYRVNWVSQDENALAAGVVRSPDTITQPLKFDYP